MRARLLSIANSRFAYIFLVAPFIALTVLPQFASEGILSYSIIAFVYLGFASAWNLTGGYLGELSFGHVAFFGIGMYTVGLIDLYRLSIPVPLDIILGGAIAAAVGAIVAYPLFRTTGIYFSIVTLGLSEVIRLLIANQDFTNGMRGIFMRIPEPYSIIPVYYGGLIMACFVLVVSLWIIRSPLRMAFLAIRDNPDGARAVGIHVTTYKILNLAITACLTGIVGGYFAHYRLFVDPESAFDQALNFRIIVATMFGGSSTFGGPILGSLIVLILEEVGRTYIQYGYLLLLTVLMIATVLFMPGGIMGVLTRRRPLQSPIHRRRKTAKKFA